jgi:hypothetical protein
MNNPEIFGNFKYYSTMPFYVNSTGGTSITEKGICWEHKRKSDHK